MTSPACKRHSGRLNHQNEPVAEGNTPMVARSRDHTESIAEFNKCHRYDVTILANGLPLVHIELKRRGVDIIEGLLLLLSFNKEFSTWTLAETFTTAHC